MKLSQTLNVYKSQIIRTINENYPRAIEACLEDATANSVKTLDILLFDYKEILYIVRSNNGEGFKSQCSKGNTTMIFPVDIIEGISDDSLDTFILVLDDLRIPGGIPTPITVISPQDVTIL